VKHPCSQIQSFVNAAATPAEHLAWDEALLEYCEQTGLSTLRFWEPDTYFIVLGLANEVAKETNPAACERLGIPILRRCSGGGAVVQGPGCLNYSLVLPLAFTPGLETVTGANRHIMERHTAALSELLGRAVEWRGCTDLALDGRKFSGNAQRRARHSLLFHGTFLLNFDLQLVSQVMPQPSRQPGYRAGRAHGDFLINLGMSADVVCQSLRTAWNAGKSSPPQLEARVDALVQEKYARIEWNLRR